MKATTRKNNRIAISWGDPAGVGPEVVLKSFVALPKSIRNRITVFGDIEYFHTLNKLTGANVQLEAVGQAGRSDDCLRIEQAVTHPYSANNMGKALKKCGASSMIALDKAIGAVMQGRFGALVTAPINKESVNRAGYKIPGHTEYLQARVGVANVAMMLASKQLKVVPATTHMALSKVPKALTKEKLVALIRLIDASMKQYGLPEPVIAVCGLNPHASDGGLFGKEEGVTIAPAIRQARRSGINVTGPYSADAMFTSAARAGYDVAVAMYHDQGLIPVKALSFGKTANITLGLPFIRVSPDHGTAFDIAGKNRADAGPMVHAIITANRMLAGKL